MSNIMLALETQSQASEFPWAALITAAVAVLSTIATFWFTNRREAGRQEHERRLHNADLADRQEARREQGESERFAQLREERLKAYAELNRLASTFDPNEYNDLFNSLKCSRKYA